MQRVLKDTLQSEWSDLEPHFDKFLVRCPYYDKHKMIAEVLAGQAVLWRWKDGFVLGKPVQYHNEEVFFIEATGGENYKEGLAEWEEAEADIRAWGYDVIEFCVRKGMTPELKKLGYVDSNLVTMRKSYVR
jgi:hypothetical protein